MPNSNAQQESANVGIAIELTKDQKQALSDLLDFVHGDSDGFILKGAAGSGKTFLLSILFEELERSYVPYKVLAPTGRAARVLRQKTGKHAATIHSCIYGKGVLSETKSGQSYRLKFPVKTSNEAERTVFIIDEASMISDAEHENDASHLKFGTGKLLSDLLTYVNSGPGKEKSKFIFVGDPSQLPPVGSMESPALDEDYLRVQAGLIVETAELSSVLRQRSGSGILELAIHIRKSLDNAIYNELVFDNGRNDVLDVDDGKVEAIYGQLCQSRGKEETILIVPTNALAQTYNRRIRKRLFHATTSSIVPGDRLIVSQNNYASNLLNGDFVSVVDTNDNLESVRPLRDITLLFRDIKIQPDDEREPFWCKMLETHLLSDWGHSSLEIIQALWVDFKSRHKGLKVKDPAFAEALETDLYFNALRVKHGYAITCHKSQGGEWQYVTVAFDSDQGQQNEAFFRWTYTAITRAKRALMVVSAPCFTPITDIDFAPAPEDARQGELDSLQEAQLIKAFASHDIDASIRQLNYRLRIDVSRENATSRIDLIYNGNQLITKIEISQVAGDEGSIRLLETDISNIAANWQGRTICLGAPPPSSAFNTSVRTAPEVPEFPDDMPFLKALYRKLSTELKLQGIEIQSVTHKAWCEQYRFASEGGSIEVDFYYNGKSQFSKVMPKGPDTAGIYQAIQEILKCE